MKKIFFAVVTLLLGCSVMSFCASKPDWLNGESKKYPKSAYLVGVGVADTVDAAKSAAMAEISKMFSVTVQQTSVDTNSESTMIKSEKKEAQSNVSAQTQTMTSTEGTLQGVEIADTWKDKKTNNFYALAVLNKEKVKQQLSSQIADLEENIQQQTDLGKKASSNVEKVKAFSIALASMDKKDELVARRNVVDSMPIPEPGAGNSRTQLKAMKDDALKHIAFVVDTSSSPSLGSLISGKISALGFKTLPSAPAQPDPSLSVILVNCSVDVAPFERGNPNWKFYTWKASAKMTELGVTNGDFANISEQGESSHLSDETARSKAYIDADNTIAKSIEQRIKQNILGE